MNELSSKNRITSIFNNLIATGRVIYHKCPGLILWILLPIRLICRLIYTILRIARLDMWIIAGFEKTSGQEMSIAFAGLEVNKNYLAGLAFSGLCSHLRDKLEDYDFTNLVQLQQKASAQKS